MAGIIGQEMPEYPEGTQQDEQEDAADPGEAKEPDEAAGESPDEAGNGKYKTAVAKTLPPGMQGQFEAFVLAGMKMMYAEDFQDDIRQAMSSTKPDFQKVAETVATGIGSMDRQAGGKVPAAIMVCGAIELVYELADYTNKLGLTQLDDAATKQASQYVVVLLMKGGGASNSQIMEAMTGMGSQQPQKPGAEQTTGGANGV